MEGSTLAPPFPKLLADSFEPIRLDAAELLVIQATGNENIRPQDLSTVILSHRKYFHYLIAQMFLAERMAEWQEETRGLSNQAEIVLNRILGLLGKTAIRNLIACAGIRRILGEPNPTHSEEKISILPSHTIPFALEAEKICENKNWLFPEVAFCGGLHYDWMAALVKKKKGTHEERTALKTYFQEGIIAAKLAYLVGLQVKNIQLAKFLFSAGLVLPLGKVLMTVLFPNTHAELSWEKFVKEAEKLTNKKETEKTPAKSANQGAPGVEKAPVKKSDFYEFFEEKRFQVTHLELSSLFVNFGELLRETEKALYFAAFPTRLEEDDFHHFQLASILSVVRCLILDSITALEPHHLKWLQANQISLETLKTIETEARKS